MFISGLIQSAYFLSLFELVSLLSKQFNAFKAYVLLQHVFSLGQKKKIPVFQVTLEKNNRVGR